MPCVALCLRMGKGAWGYPRMTYQPLLLSLDCSLQLLARSWRVFCTNTHEAAPGVEAIRRCREISTAHKLVLEKESQYKADVAR